MTTANAGAGDTATRPRVCRKCRENDPQRMVRDRNKPGGISTVCRACASSAARACYASNPEPGRARMRAYRAANSEADRESNRVRYAANIEASQERSRARRAAYAARTPEKVLADRARLRPDRVKWCRSCAERQSLTAFQTDLYTPDGLRDICRPCSNALRKRHAHEKAWHALGIDSATCVYCRAPAEHADHVLSRSLGGRDEGNLLPARAMQYHQ